MTLFIGSKRELFPEGFRFEGAGIDPDIEICPAVADLQ